MFSTLTRSWLTKTITACSLFLVTGFSSPSSAQVMQTGRFEVPVQGRGEFFDIIPSSGNGLFLHRQLAGIKDDQVHLIKLDTTFKQDWAGFISVEKNYRVMGERTYNEKLFLLLRYKDYSKNDLILFVIQEQDGRFIQYHVKSYIPFSPTEFQITDESAVIGGYYNRIPV